MANTTRTNVQLIAAELAGTNTALFELILSDVVSEVSFSLYGADQERAQRYLAAHYLTLASPLNVAGSAGPAVSIKTGDLAEKYAMMSFKDSSRYDETSYGRTFISIRRTKIIGFGAVQPG